MFYWLTSEAKLQANAEKQAWKRVKCRHCHLRLRRVSLSSDISRVIIFGVVSLISNEI